MSDIRRVGDSGVHTVEGAVAGRRAVTLANEREAQRQEYETLKSKIKEENSVGLGRIDDKFSSSSLVTEVFEGGLITADQTRTLAERQAQQQEEARKAAAAAALAEENKRKEREAKRKKLSSALSFNADEDGEGEGEGEGASASAAVAKPKAKPAPSFSDEPVLKKICKDPTAATAFLPDRQRDAELEAEKQRLKDEWMNQQETIKNELLEVVYSYWDGSGHRNEMNVRKGTTVGHFLELVKKQLAPTFRELQSINSDGLMYVKEDLIIPQHYTFYDLIITKARGKSGPLFHFDVHDDVRLVSDARIEKDESHPGKIVDRRWYERNKHIFPASRWEVYDPAVSRERYTIHGGEVNAKK